MLYKKMLALDYGTHKTGIAYSVESFAFSWKTIPTKNLREFLPKLIEEKKIELIIIGMPYNIDGTDSIHAKRVRSFIQSIRNIIHIPIVHIDEGLTTSEARLDFHGDDIEWDIDAEAARKILERYIHELS